MFIMQGLYTGLDKMKNRKITRNLIFVTVAVLFGIAAATAVYINDCYHADEEAIAAYSASINGITIEHFENGCTVYEPRGAKSGFIFYPGGKVEASSYEPLMEACAKQGIMCILVEMPGNLAVLDVNAADGLQEQFPDIKNWYIGGHSLGGSMAASYVSDRAERYGGLILLASYSTADLSDTELDVLSVYGSEDKVLDLEKYEENKANLPDDFEEAVIAGGCHAGFGMYGKQDGDGTPEITSQQQIDKTARMLAEFMTE